MAIRGFKTINEYKEVRLKRVELWFFLNFEPGFFSYKITGNSVIVTDLSGDSVKVSLNEIL